MINPHVRQVMEENGIDMSGQRSKDIDEYMGKMHFGYLITVCSNAEERCPRIFPGVSERLHWPFDDPAAFEGTDEEKLARTRKVRDQIEEQIKEWLAELESKGS